ncbi:MAG: tripartite tricarboxylate transporter TctB family protein [Clostridia bacterium]|nr:tripartite tricarboxylate transporter TctB family protein [Clostridia bacterium]
MSNPKESQEINNLKAAVETEKETVQDLSSYVPEKHRKPGETTFAIIATVFGVLGYYFALGMTSENLSSPSVFPKLASIIIVICGVICIYRACKKEPPEAGSPSVFRYLLPKDVIVVLALLLVYCIALPRLHFIPSSYAFMVIGMIYLHRGKNIWQSFLISACAMAVLVAVFRYVFLVILP